MVSEEELDEVERKVMDVFAVLNASSNKNIKEGTIRKRLPRKYHKDFPDALKSLIAKGVVRKKRKENYDLTKKGFEIAMKLRDRREEHIKELFGLTRIIKH